MSERNAAAGYLALSKETVKGTAVTPANYVPYYKQSMITDPHFMTDAPVYGDKFRRFQTLQGIRSHLGSFSVMAEPNTAAYFMDMLSTRTTTTGSNPYTHTFKSSTTTDPNSYTVDISLVSQVVRFMGVEASKITFAFDQDKMVLDLDTAALGSFYGREVASIATTVVTLTTTYDPTPTNGLVVGDLVRVVKADGSSKLDTTVSSLTATTVTLGASAAAFAAGDMVVLRPATPSLSLLTPFLWPRTQFCIAADAATALSATQTRLDPGTQISLMHNFDSNSGTPRSGAFDPASLPRTTYDLEIKVKKYFDTAADIKTWNALTKQALVMRSYSGADKELRLTINNIKALTYDTATDSGNVIIANILYVPNYDSGDTQGFDGKVINAVAVV